ncbi:Dimethylglycine N-methyltransferase [Planctomycetes bacterium Pla163]|uniref:Dimethylglycine N-methyltransferase n=1 Tax=Rohdeia mirabilis TaxID=2528008 RepID=A0A518CUT6_9BACT|nr:Dimethylglycine N-methyltransferase [Planctomycetes bacterium Pla163]
MSAASPTPEELFFELFESLPRQGPGSRACTERALAACPDLPRAPCVLDLGCGGGAQTFDLAELTDGPIVALDRHAPLVEQLRAHVFERGLASRVLPAVGDMARLPLGDASVDLVWSEGAFYSVGLRPALVEARRVLRAGGYLAFTDAVWRTDDAPDEVRAMFADYPSMGGVDDLLAAVAEEGFQVLEHFVLPDAAWWEDFYAPMERRIRQLRAANAGDSDALAILDELAAEPELHRRHGSTYGYAFVVARR